MVSFSDFTVESQNFLLGSLPPTPSAIEDFSIPSFLLRDDFMAGEHQNVLEKHSERAKHPCTRKLWGAGTVVEVFSHSYGSWITGQINSIGFDEEGEFCEVHYTTEQHEYGEKKFIKYLNRYDKHLRPIAKAPPNLQNIAPSFASEKFEKQKAFLRNARDASRYESSRGSETLDFSSNNSFANNDEVGGSFCDLDSEANHRFAWLSASEFEGFFGCRLHPFLLHRARKYRLSDNSNASNLYE